MKFTGSPVKYGMDRLIQMPDSMVSSSTSGSAMERNVTKSTHRMATTAMPLTTTLSTATMFFMSYRFADWPAV